MTYDDLIDLGTDPAVIEYINDLNDQLEFLNNIIDDMEKIITQMESQL